MVCGGQTPPEQKWKTTLSSPPSSSYPLPPPFPPKHTHALPSIRSSGRLVRHQILTALLGYPQRRQDRWNNLCSFFSAQVSSGQASFRCIVGLIQGVTRIIQMFRKKLTTSLKLELLPTRRNLPPVTRRSFHLSTFFRFPRRWNSLSKPQCSLPVSLFFPNHLFFAILCHLPVFQKKKISVDLLHLPDDLLLEDRQDGVVVTHLLEHDPAVKLVAHFLEVEPVHTHTHTHENLIISQSNDVKSDS